MKIKIEMFYYLNLTSKSVNTAGILKSITQNNGIKVL